MSTDHTMANDMLTDKAQQASLQLASGLDAQDQKMLVDAPGSECVDLSGWQTQGMRAACNGRVLLDGVTVAPDAVIGEPGDYLRQPDFSAGAWRASAVALGGLEALVRAMRDQLVARGRQDDTRQLARVGRVLIAQETAALWVRRAAMIGEAQDNDASDIANTVNLARIAVEAACLDVLHIAQRGLGLAAFRCGDIVELLLRDLATYLRQPAPDEALTEAAGHFMRRDLPPLP
jgi:alkylation response protein AidB-like acyl-CoA dehydrogenase